MEDLILTSKCHKRYENGVPVMGLQHGERILAITKSDFRKLMKGAPVIPDKGYLVRMLNTDIKDANGNYQEMMQPKLMQLVSDTVNKIELRGVTLKIMGVTGANFNDYARTLHLVKQKVTKCILHMLDRNIDIEYLDIQQ